MQFKKFFSVLFLISIITFSNVSITSANILIDSPSNVFLSDEISEENIVNNIALGDFSLDINMGKNLESYLKENISIMNEMIFETDLNTLDSRDNFISRYNNIRAQIEEYMSLSNEINNDFYNSVLFNELLNTYERLDLKINDFNTKKSRATLWRNGNILYYGIGSNNASEEKSFTGHVAVMSNTPNYVIEASKTGSNGAKVFHWNVSNLWKGASGIKEYKVTSTFGTDATSTQKSQAINYGLQQLGEPYALKTTIWSTDAWYCSKLVNAMWDSAGYNLESLNKFSLDGLIMVLPKDIVADSNVRLVKTWGTTLPN